MTRLPLLLCLLLAPALLADDGTQDAAKLDPLIAQLGAKAFKEREAAMDAIVIHILATRPVAPEQPHQPKLPEGIKTRLEAAAKDTDPERARRARQLLGGWRDFLEPLPDWRTRVCDELLAQLPGDLTALDLTECKGITAAGLKKLAARCPQLKRLDLADCPLQDLSMLVVLPLFTKLEVLSLGRTPLSELALDGLSKLTSLRELWLDGMWVTDSGLKALAPLVQLRQLHLVMERLTPHPEWRGRGKPIMVSKKGAITQQGLALIAKMTQLEGLSLSGADRITDADLATLKPLTKLRELSLADCRSLSGAGLQHLAGSPIERLSLARVDRVDDAGLLVVGKLTKLRALDLNMCDGFTATGLARAVATLPELRWLDLNWCKTVDDTTLAAIGKLQHLEELRLAYCHKVGDAGIAALAGCSKLKTLHLQGTLLPTDACLTTLAKLQSLRTLSLGSKSSITHEGVERIRAALPKAKIGHRPNRAKSAQPRPK